MKKIATFTLVVMVFSATPLAQAMDYQPIFEKFTGAKGWNWNTVKTLPKAGNDMDSLKKDPNFKGRYSLERTLSNGSNSTVTAYGSQSAPNTLVFYSGGWGVTNPANLLKLSDVVNPANLTKVKSNCNFGKVTDNYTAKDNKGNRYDGSNYIDFQNVYKWTRAGSIPLYVVEQQGGGWMTGNSGVNSSVIITPSLAQLKTAIVQHGWHKNSTGKLVGCTFS